MNSKWFYSISKEKKAVILLAHGLNLSPHKMDELASFFTHHNCDVLRIDLGRDPLHWEENFALDLKAAINQTDEKKLPLYFVGFSLGALMGIHFLCTKDKEAFKKMALLAPATHTQFYTTLPALLGHFFPGLSLPSLNLKTYREKSGTTLLEYKKIYELQKSIKKDLLKNNINIPTLLITSRKDELVHSRRLKIWAHTNPFWQSLEISNSLSQLPRKYHHLMIDEASLGREEWEKLLQSLCLHFEL